MQSAVDAYGLKALSGSDGEVTVKEDVATMAKGYKKGDSLQFTATFRAAQPKPSEEAVETADDASVVMDVAAETA